MLRRDWRAGELSVLIAALLLAAASVGTVGFFADRVKGALATQANVLLGADLMVSADRPLPPELCPRSAARRPRHGTGHPLQQHGSGGRQRRGARRRQGRWRTAIRCVARLRSSLRGAPEGAAAQRVPRRGEAWSDTRLAARSGSPPGSRLTVGDTTLTVAAIVQQDPEVAGWPADARSAPAHEHRRRAGDQAAAAGQSRRLSPARGRQRDRRLSRMGAAASGARTAAGVDPRPAAGDPANPRARGQIPRPRRARRGDSRPRSRWPWRRRVTCAAISTRRRCCAASARRSDRRCALFVIQFGVLGLGASAVGTLLALGGQQLLVSLLGAVIHADLPPPGVAAGSWARWSRVSRCCSALRCRRSLLCRACRRCACFAAISACRRRAARLPTARARPRSSRWSPGRRRICAPAPS